MTSIKNRVSNFLDAHFYNFIDKLILASVSLLVIVFILYPLLMVLIKSFIIDGKISFLIYKNLLGDNIKLLYNSIFVASITALLSSLIAISMSIYTVFSSKRIRNILIPIYMLTMISPPFVSSLSYITLFGRRGFITHDILGLTLNTYGWQGIISMETLGFVSLNTLILIAFIKNIDKNTIDASLDLGVDFSRTIYSIVIPLMKPGILVVFLLTFIRSLSDFGTPMIIGGSFNVLATEAYLNVIAYGNLEKASAISVLILIPSILAFYVYHKFISKSSSIEINEEEFEGTYGSKKGILLFFKLITFLTLGIILLQYSSIIVSSFTKYRRGDIYFTLENYLRVKEYSLDSFTRSIVYSIIAAIFGSALGFLIAYYFQTRKMKFMKYIDFISTAPYIIPGTFFGIGYILAFNKYPIELTGTALIVILNVLFKQLPMSTKVNNSKLSQINPEILQSARDLGAKDVFILKDILLPYSKSSFMISFINNFTATMTTIGSIIFLVYPGKKLATIEMFDAIQSGEYAVGASIACSIILITMIINILFSKIILEGKNVFSNKKSL